MSAEWLLVLGGVLAVSARTRLDLERTNRELLAAQEHLRTVADRDPLTALTNRRALPDVFRAVQPGGAMLLFFDLDGFKALNDRHGHLAGDRCLREFAAALREAFRPTDYVIHYGGDEFLVVGAGPRSRLGAGSSRRTVRPAPPRAPGRAVVRLLRGHVGADGGRTARSDAPHRRRGDVPRQGGQVDTSGAEFRRRGRRGRWSLSSHWTRPAARSSTSRRARPTRPCRSSP